jgi:hypothetical protein
MDSLILCIARGVLLQLYVHLSIPKYHGVVLGAPDIHIGLNTSTSVEFANDHSANRGQFTNFYTLCLQSDQSMQQLAAAIRLWKTIHQGSQSLWDWKDVDQFIASRK